MLTNMAVLIEKRKEYINSEADKIVNEMVRRGVCVDTLSTCDYFNWDRELHRSMPQIIVRLKELGISSSCTVRYGVTDWIFNVIEFL